MTAKQLRDALALWPDDAVVLVEVRYKTGYDKGDVWECDVKSVMQRSPSGPVKVELEGGTLVGGW